MKDKNMLHYGIKRKSGRYEWGSGEEPYQSSPFLRRYDTLLDRGLSQTEIAKEMGINTRELREKITWGRKEQKQYLMEAVQKSRDEGMNKTEIGAKLGISEATVRNYLNPKEKHQKMQLENINKALTDGVEKTGYLDVGPGVEVQLQVSRTRLNAVVNKMVKEDGYYLHNVYVSRSKDKSTTVKTLTKEPDIKVVLKNAEHIRPLVSWSDDRGRTISNISPPKSIHPDTVSIRYKEDGGAGKDGLIEMRPGVEDLSMGASKYAQVRIKVGEDKFIKGMAVYGDPKDFPEGVDIIFNTNKTKDVPKMKVLKPVEVGTDNIFGSTIMRQNKSNVLNIVNEEGEWNEWSSTLASQFLSKQPHVLIKDRLEATYDGLLNEFDDLSKLTNPVVKQAFMEDFSDSLVSKAKKLDAKGLPHTKSHVILPYPDMNPDEIYAPQYSDGDRVVLLRYPHGGTFELPEVTVNNKHAGAKKQLGIAPDAIGIHPSVAEKLSGADFDGDTVYVIPNHKGPLQIKTSRSLKELKNFDPGIYTTADPENFEMKERTKQTQMGMASNLITDMSLKGAVDSEIARAVRHSMVVIDAKKHQYEYQQSARDNGIAALKKKYQSHINPDTEKKSSGASTLISLSKRKIDITQASTARDLAKDRMDRDGNILKKGMTTEDIATKLKVSKKTIEKYLDGEDFDPGRYSSGTPQEELYVSYIKKLQSLKNTTDKTRMTIQNPTYDREAAKVYKSELDSLNAKLDVARLNAPKERQAVLLAKKLYFANVVPDMEKDQKKKLRNRSITRARETTGAKGREALVNVSPREWEAIQANAISTTKLKEVIRYGDKEQIRNLASPKKPPITEAQKEKARDYIKKGYTYSETARKLGTSTESLNRALRKPTNVKTQRIQALVKRGYTYDELSKMLGISTSAIAAAVNEDD